MKTNYKLLFIIGFYTWLLGTIFGGFKDTPQSVYEKLTDMFGAIFMIWGIVGDITQNLTIVKNSTIYTAAPVTINQSKEYAEDKKS